MHPETRHRAVATVVNRLRLIRRDWPLVMFALACCAAGIACLSLAACSTYRTRPDLATTIPVPEIAPPKPAPIATPPPKPTIESAPQPWRRMRAGFNMPDCEAGAAALIWAKRYSQHPAGFSESLKQAMPLLLYVLDQTENKGLATEFTMLPYVESTYNPAASGSGQAAGMWQLMPATARGNGLRVGKRYDQRLDPVASTRVALKLLDRYHRTFHDWRLADMAFNAGEYRIRKALHGHRDASDAKKIASIGINATTREHLAKLQGLACIVSQPSRFGVKLPAAGLDDVLAVVELPSAVDLRLAARLSGIDYEQVRALNPAYRNARMPAQGPFRLLLPVKARDALTGNLASIPEAMRRARWRELVLHQPESLDVLAYANDIRPEYLAAVNRLQGSTELNAGSRILLPDHSSYRTQRSVDTVPDRVARRFASYVVRRGDTLSGIAARAHVHVEDLCRWNGIDQHSTLRLGQRLRLASPDDVATSATSGASAN